VSNNVEVFDDLEKVARPGESFTVPEESLGYTPVNVAGDTMTGPLALGTGDAEQIFVATTGQRLNSFRGAAASPDTSPHPVVKNARLIELLTAAVTGDGGEQAAVGLDVAVGTASNQVQVVGRRAGAISVGAYDAAALYGTGIASTGSTGVAIGVVAAARRTVDTGKVSALQVTSGNLTATAGTYGTTGLSDTGGGWIVASGNSDSGAGLVFGNPYGMQFKVGIGFPAQVAGGKTGAVADSSFRDDGTAAQSIDIRGTHATAAIHVANGSGPVLIGIDAAVSSASRLEVISALGSTASAMIRLGSTSGSLAHIVQLRNGLATHNMFIAGSAGDFLTGTAGGDAGWRSNSSGKAFHIGGTVSCIKVTTANAVLMPNLPTSNPAVAGQLWNNAGVLTVSAG
jgi:uncharacterized protein YaiE (UPF0345 family)